MAEIFTGARAKLKLKNKTIGYATGCTGSEEITYEPVRAMDNIQVKEFVPIGYEVTFSASHVRIMGEGLRDQGIFPMLGQSAEEFLDNILQSADLEVQITDFRGPNGAGTGKMFMNLYKARITRHNWTITARGIVGEDIDFVASRMYDEAEAAP